MLAPRSEGDTPCLHCYLLVITGKGRYLHLSTLVLGSCCQRPILVSYDHQQVRTIFVVWESHGWSKAGWSRERGYNGGVPYNKLKSNHKEFVWSATGDKYEFEEILCVL